MICTGLLEGEVYPFVKAEKFFENSSFLDWLLGEGSRAGVRGRVTRARDMSCP